MRLDELRHRSAESAREEAEALDRHAPAAARDAAATRELAEAAGDLAAVQLSGFVAGGSRPVSSAGGSASGTGAGTTIGTGGGSGGGQGFAVGPQFLSSQSGQGRQGGILRAEQWIGENCSRATFEVPNPQNSNALAEEDFVQVPGWDCSGALGVPPGTVVFYDPEAWEALLGVARISKVSTGGSAGGRTGSARPLAYGGPVNKNTGRGGGSAGGTGTFGAPAPSFNSAASTAPTLKTERLLGDMVALQRDTLTELRKRPAGPSGTKGQRLI